MEILPILAAAIALAGLLSSAVKDILKSRKPAPPKPALQERIEALQANMKASAVLIDQISTEMEARAMTAESLKAEAEQAQQIASLHKEQEAAVLRAMRAQMSDETKQASRRDLRINVLIFFAGVAASVLVTLLIHPI